MEIDHTVDMAYSILITQELHKWWWHQSHVVPVLPLDCKTDSIVWRWIEKHMQNIDGTKVINFDIYIYQVKIIINTNKYIPKLNVD